MYARVASFEGDPAEVDQAVEFVKSQGEQGPPPGLEDSKGFLMLVDRESGKGLGITLWESEDAMRKGDEALNAMTPPQASGRRTSVEFYEVPHTVMM